MGRPAPQIPIGAVFGLLTVIDNDPSLRRADRQVYRCRCRCGAILEIRGTDLRRPRNVNPNSCGRCEKRAITHGKSGTRTHAAWQQMRNRCRNPHCPAWDRYGGRGIKVCERWDSYENFLADMGERPAGRYSIERKNNDGDYEPGNCRWATKAEQAQNRSTTKATAEIVAAIRSAPNRRAQLAIAKANGLSGTVLYGIRTGRTWPGVGVAA